MRRYKFPLLSRAAWYIQRYLVPQRVLAWVFLEAYDQLDSHMRSIEHHDPEDGSVEYFDGVSAIRLENIKRKLCANYLRAELVEK